MSVSPHQAAVEGDNETIKKWLRETNNVNEKDGGGWTALHCAVQANQLETAELILKHPNVCVHTVNHSLSTILHYAVRSTKPNSQIRGLMSLLLEHGFLFRFDCCEFKDLFYFIDKEH